MKPLNQFTASNLSVLFTDIDDTLTSHGRLPANSYEKLWTLSQAGIRVIPVTGRPAGWCELIARQWPVHGVIGENGAFYFRHDARKMSRNFFLSEAERRLNRQRLDNLLTQILAQVPGASVSSDQFCRLFDLAIDCSEDVTPLSKAAIQKIVTIFEQAGAQAKVSSIHINGWFGTYDKVTMCKTYAQRELGLKTEAEMKNSCAFIGDSPNDEPMFAFFDNSFAVSNILNFKDQLKSLPKYITNQPDAEGFVEFAEHLLNCIKN